MGLRLLPLLLCALLSVAQPALSRNPTATLPSVTDAQIKDFDQPHLSWLPTVPQREQLLVFLPGTGGSPKKRFPLAETAAALGYHVILNLQMGKDVTKAFL